MFVIVWLLCLPSGCMLTKFTPTRQYKKVVSFSPLSNTSPKCAVRNEGPKGGLCDTILETHSFKEVQ